MGTVVPAAVRFTYREYACLPADGRRWELVDGDFLVTPAPAPLHQTVSRRLQYALMTQLEETGIAFVFNAPIDVILEETTVLQPDLAIVAADQRGSVSERGIEGPPALVVEILSPSTTTNDRFLKRGLYARFGVGEYWIVDPLNGFVEVMVLEPSGYRIAARHDRASTLTSPRFAEVSIGLERVFRPL
jgi:Uma2 family endonuclease